MAKKPGKLFGCCFGWNTSFFQCQIWKILVCGAQICDMVRWSDEETTVSTGEMCPRNGDD